MVETLWLERHDGVYRASRIWRTDGSCPGGFEAPRRSREERDQHAERTPRPRGAPARRARSIELLDVLDNEGEEARIVGGAVRNALTGLPVSPDIDLASTALPKEVDASCRPRRLQGGPDRDRARDRDRHRRWTPFRGDHATRGHRDGRPPRRGALRTQLRGRCGCGAISPSTPFRWTDAARLHDTVGGMAGPGGAKRLRFIGDPKLPHHGGLSPHPALFPLPCELRRGARSTPRASPPRSACARVCAGLSAERVRGELLQAGPAPGAAATAQEMLAGGFWPLILGGVPHVGRFKTVVEAKAADPEMRGAMARLAALAVLTSERRGSPARALAPVECRGDATRTHRTRARAPARYPVAPRGCGPKREVHRPVGSRARCRERARRNFDRSGGDGERPESRVFCGSRAQFPPSRYQAPISSSAASPRVRRSGASWHSRARPGSTRVVRSRNLLFRPFWMRPRESGPALAESPKLDPIGTSNRHFAPAILPIVLERAICQPG